MATSPDLPHELEHFTFSDKEVTFQEANFFDFPNIKKSGHLHEITEENEDICNLTTLDTEEKEIDPLGLRIPTSTSLTKEQLNDPFNLPNSKANHSKN